MRTKKNRKDRGQSPGAARLWNLGGPALFKIKFDTSISNISCFIGHPPSSLKLTKKKSHSFSQPTKSASRNKPKPVQKIEPLPPLIDKPKKRDSSPDIVKECSNPILSKIEEKGINCAWYDMEETNQINDAHDLTIWSAFDNNSGHDKSFASTNDFHHYHTIATGQLAPYSASWSPLIESQLQGPSQVLSNPFQIQPDLIQNDWRTTLMIRNVPNKYTIGDLAAEIDVYLANTYDFLYLPCDFKNQCNVGYGFINFINTASLEIFYNKFHHYYWKKYRSEKICALTYARLQGLNQLIEHFENSKVLNQKDKKYRPIIKYDQIHKMILEQQGQTMPGS